MPFRATGVIMSGKQSPQDAREHGLVIAWFIVTIAWVIAAAPDTTYEEMMGELLSQLRSCETELLTASD